MLKNILYNLLTSLVDVAFPPICQCCGKKLTSSKFILCHHCYDKIPYTYYWNNPYNKLYGKINSFESIDSAFSLFTYKVGSGYDKIIHNFKYRNQPMTAYRLGRWLGERIVESGRIGEFDFIIPVPLHISRRRWRGYNQSLYIARGVASVTGIDVRDDLLIRKRGNKQQSKIKDHKKRFANVTGVFTVTQPSQLTGRNILLIDDVITSGATIVSCISTMRQSAKKCVISVASIASTE